MVSDGVMPRTYLECRHTLVYPAESCMHIGGILLKHQVGLGTFNETVRQILKTQELHDVSQMRGRQLFAIREWSYGDLIPHLQSNFPFFSFMEAMGRFAQLLEKRVRLPSGELVELLADHAYIWPLAGFQRSHVLEARWVKQRWVLSEKNGEVTYPAGEIMLPV